MVLALACGRSEPSPLPPDTFAFGVFGDGPYRAWENGRFRRLIDDVNGHDIEWLLHVGDLLWYPCSDRALSERLRALNSIRHPVVYTPGDNEWADCHETITGGYLPLERLDHVRKTFFADPRTSLGGRSMAVESQGRNPAWSEFVENARWTFGGFVFVTIHMVGSDNALARFDGRTAADDAEVARRSAAALDWLDAAFSVARSDSASGVVIAIHGDPSFEDPRGAGRGYATFVDRLAEQVTAFPGQVVLIHGDSHIQRADNPLRADSGQTLRNFTRIESYGSPDIGWVRVVIDSVAGRVVASEPRLMRWRLFW